MRPANGRQVATVGCQSGDQPRRLSPPDLDPRRTIRERAGTITLLTAGRELRRVAADSELSR